MKESPFFQQAELVFRLLPLLHAEENLALKGGSAINYFVRDFPRLSVDIDLTYIPVTDRQSALQDISSSLSRISKWAERNINGISIRPKQLSGGTISTLFVQRGRNQIKVGVNLVIRGTLHPCRDRNVCSICRTIFKQSPKVRVLSFSDLFGGKLCAALDRQHPRDLFDVKLLLENEGITKEVRKAFIVYLISHSRPISELLNPNFKDIRDVFENEFQGMTRVPVKLQELLNVREKLLEQIRQDLTSAERYFILSIKDCRPDWGLLGIEGIDRLPAVQWKLKNLEGMNRKKRAEAVEKLKRCLNM